MKIYTRQTNDEKIVIFFVNGISSRAMARKNCGPRDFLELQSNSIENVLSAQKVQVKAFFRGK
jgi:hypothetical protein